MGYVNLKGEVVISPTFYYAEAIYKEAAIVLYQNGKDTEVGYISTDETPLFEKRFAIANNFSEGLALASVDDKSMVILIKPESLL